MDAPDGTPLGYIVACASQTQGSCATLGYETVTPFGVKCTFPPHRAPSQCCLHASLSPLPGLAIALTVCSRGLRRAYATWLFTAVPPALRPQLACRWRFGL